MVSAFFGYSLDPLSISYCTMLILVDVYLFGHPFIMLKKFKK